MGLVKTSWLRMAAGCTLASFLGITSSFRRYRLRAAKMPRFTTSLANPWVLDVAPDSSQLLLLESHLFQQDSQFWLQPLPAGSPRRIGVVGHDASWLPDGKLMFAKGSDVFVAEHDGSNARKLLTVPGSPGGIRLSPDRSRIRFTVEEFASGIFSLWEAHVDGTKPHPLLPNWNNPPQECCGNWTSDGKYF